MSITKGNDEFLFRLITTKKPSSRSRGNRNGGARFKTKIVFRRTRTEYVFIFKIIFFIIRTWAITFMTERNLWCLFVFDDQGWHGCSRAFVSLIPNDYSAFEKTIGNVCSSSEREIAVLRERAALSTVRRQNALKCDFTSICSRTREFRLF